jgi:hypothetical protein
MPSNFSEVKFQCRTCYLNTLKKIDHIPFNAISCLLPAMVILPSSNINKFLHHKVTHCFHLVIMWWSQVYSPVHPKTNEIHNDPEKSVLSSCSAGLYMEQLFHIDLILYKYLQGFTVSFHEDQECSIFQLKSLMNSSRLLRSCPSVQQSRPWYC